VWLLRQPEKEKKALSLCETIDGGRLREAAEAKNDEGILLHIRGKDCVAAELTIITVIRNT
jgi:hypothetical protein